MHATTYIGNLPGYVILFAPQIVFAKYKWTVKMMRRPARRMGGHLSRFADCAAPTCPVLPRDVPLDRNS